jgi:hypothetical protein
VVVVVVDVPGGSIGLSDCSVVVVLSVVVVTRSEPHAARKAVPVRSAAPTKSCIHGVTPMPEALSEAFRSNSISGRSWTTPYHVSSRF